MIFLQNTDTAHADAKGLRALLGKLSGKDMADILNTGATYQEIKQALIWLDDDASLGFALDIPVTHRMRQVYDILKARQENLDRYAL